MADPALICFRQDLRLTDNPALLAAELRRGPVVPVFIWAPDEEGRWPPGAASRWWLHQSLAHLNETLRELGSRLVIRCGPTLETIRELIRQTGATAVYWNRRYEPAAADRDRRVAADLARNGVMAEIFNGSLLFEPAEVSTKQGEPYRVFTPFWKACRELPAPTAPSRKPTRLRAPARWPAGLALQELDLEPKIDWAAGLREAWQPGEAGAREQLARFRDDALADYPSMRDRPDRSGTSRLSPHLHFGEISVREVWHAIHGRPPAKGRRNAVDVYARELGWREFAYHLLVHFPNTPDRPLQAAFAKFPWKRNDAVLRAWQRGRTGFPMVDAAMHELWHTGWMHNRARMVVASFLAKDLLLPWLDGARWFWDTLVDADLANNTLGWQWTAGCGADAAPFFRIFSPVKQAQKFDPDGSYVQRWLPELARLPDRWVHRPFDAPATVLAEAGIRIGETYPRPVVEHGEAARRALAVFRRHRSRLKRS